MSGNGNSNFGLQARMSKGSDFTTGSSSNQRSNFQAATSSTRGPGHQSTRGPGPSRQGGSSRASEGSALWRGSSFLESVPLYLRSDPEVLHMADLLHREQEKQERLLDEINQRVEEAARGDRGPTN